MTITVICAGQLDVDCDSSHGCLQDVPEDQETQERHLVLCLPKSHKQHSQRERTGGI